MYRVNIEVNELVFLLLLTRPSTPSVSCSWVLFTNMSIIWTIIVILVSYCPLFIMVMWVNGPNINSTTTIKSKRMYVLFEFEEELGHSERSHDGYWRENQEYEPYWTRMDLIWSRRIGFPSFFSWPYSFLSGNFYLLSCGYAGCISNSFLECSRWRTLSFIVCLCIWFKDIWMMKNKHWPSLLFNQEYRFILYIRKDIDFG